MNAVSPLLHDNPFASKPRRWYVLCINPQRDVHTLKWLDFVYAYAPIEWTRENHGKGQKRFIIKPICPGYIFVREPRDHQWRDIHEADGVRGVLNVAGNMATISDDAIELLRRAEMQINLADLKGRKRPVSLLKPGMRARIEEESSHFHGHEILIERLDKRDKEVLGLVLPARLMTIVLPAQWLKAV